MSSKNNSGKITLGMMKGKPITTSVPAIRYHASDDELEELYPSTDDEKQPESEKSSPYKRSKNKSEENENGDSTFSKERSSSVDGIPSEGTPSSDPWKKLSQIKGKISKTIEEKLSEIKSDKKRHKNSRETSSISDSEEMGSVTPTDDVGLEKQSKESSSPLIRRRAHSSRFVGFSGIKVGLKTKNSEEDSVESGIEAAEVSLNDSNDINKSPKKSSKNVVNVTKIKKTLNVLYSEIDNSNSSGSDMESVFSQLKNKIFCQVIMILMVVWCSALIPMYEYLIGLCTGIFIAITVYKIITRVREILTTSPNTTLPVLEIPAAEEHVVLERFEGWVNELPYNYNPENYHVARTRSVFFRLEGEMLHVMETRTRIPKRAIWDEPKHNAKFTRKRIYNLSGTKVELLPHGLIRRRRWSKKYPICVTFEKDALIETTTLTNSSDEEDQQQNTEVDNNKVIVEEEETDDDLSQSKDARDEFSDCQDEIEDAKIKMFIFARTDRQKEDWYRRLVSSSNLGSFTSSVKDTTNNANSSSQTTPTTIEGKHSPSISASSEVPPELPYSSYMARYVENQSNTTAESEAASTITGDNIWVNALLGRILFDMHKCPDTINVIQDKIQRKLSNIKLPYFMESLLVSELVIGQGAPVIHKASKPILDERGLWFDLDISYEGCLTMTIETKLNLMKLKKTGSTSTNNEECLYTEKYKPARSPMFDSDVEDSPETSTEDEDSFNMNTNSASRESTPTQSSGRKFLNMVDKLAANKYFQHATELSYIRRAMEGVSNTEIRLMVSVSSIEGCLAINIPPAPSDRLWYGFRPVPRITLTAKPAVGERALNIVYVTKWIETKLLREFEKVVVIPNMDDLMIPLCTNYPYVS